MTPSRRRIPSLPSRLKFLVAAALFGLAFASLFGTTFSGHALRRTFERPSRCKAASDTASDSFVLRYFDGRGVAETARMIFVVAGKEFEDMRYPVSFGTPGDFSTIKRDEFDADKASGKLDIAFGKVPILESGNFRLPQSKAIERYLAKRFGMMGSTPEEEAWVDAVHEHIRDINDAYSKKGLFFMKDLEKKAEIQKKWFEEELPAFLAKLEQAIPGEAGFAVGSKVSLADVAIFKLLSDTFDRDVSSTYDGHQKLKAIVKNLAKHEGLQKWIAGRKQTMF